MRKPLTVAFALVLAFLYSLPALGQTTDLTVSTTYPGLTVEPGDTAGFDLVLTRQLEQHGRSSRSMECPKAGPALSAAAAL